MQEINYKSDHYELSTKKSLMTFYYTKLLEMLVHIDKR